MDCYDLKTCPGTCCSCTVPAAVEAGIAGILCDPRCEECAGKVACSRCGHEVKGATAQPELPIFCEDCELDDMRARERAALRFAVSLFLVGGLALAIVAGVATWMGVR